MKKVLFIACLYPPVANSGTQRSIKFANYLHDYGWEPIVLTVENSHEPNIDIGLLPEVCLGTRVVRVPFLSDLISRKIAKLFSAFFPEDRIAEGLEWRIRNLWKIPDAYALWQPTALKRAIQLFHEEGFDCIYASGYPWSSFILARYLSIKTGRPYVLDFRDLWTSWDGLERSSRFVRWIERCQEHNVAKNASAIVTVTESLTRELSKITTKENGKRIFCITNGYDSTDFNNALETVGSSEKIRIGYTGVWKKGYSLEQLYKAFQIIKSNFPQEINKLELLCAGFPVGPALEYALTDTVKELGQIPHINAIELMKSASVLYLNVPKGDYALWSLPGKLFEYLGAGKPIIASAPAKSEVAQVLEQVGGAVLVDPDDINGLVKLLVNIAQSDGPNWGNPDPALVKRFDRRKLTERLAEVFTSVASV